MLHSLQVALRSFNRSCAKAKRPKIHAMYITTSGPVIKNRRMMMDIPRDTFNAINIVNRVILLKGKFAEQVAH